MTQRNSLSIDTHVHERCDLKVYELQIEVLPEALLFLIA